MKPLTIQEAAPIDQKYRVVTILRKLSKKDLIQLASASGLSIPHYSKTKDLLIEGLRIRLTT